MPSSKPIPGVNDLQSQFPEIAAEAYGWDPGTITAKSNQSKDWKCKHGHIWDAIVNNRTKGRGCPVCSGYRVLEGFNDLQTKFPEIAKEAYGWDPSTTVSGTDQKKDWKCNKGHIYTSSVRRRTGERTGCPFCSGHKILKGFNDLQTKYPEIAAEAYGWDPSTIMPGTDQKKDWRCNKGHIYLMCVNGRTGKGSGCSFCSGKQVLSGFNDLQTKFPDIAEESYGWDPTTVTAGTGQKKEWQCNKGHIYLATLNARTSNGNGCPVCAGQQVLAGFNDLKTKFPEIAAEAYNWDPKTLTAQSNKKMDWKCNKGHIYSSTVANRTGLGNGCPVCAGQQVLAGFNDLQTKYPEIAAEAYGWDPSTVTAGTRSKERMEM
jgi:predicted methyltransferase